MIVRKESLPEKKIIEEIAESVKATDKNKIFHETIREEEAKRFKEIDLYKPLSESQNQNMLMELKNNLSQMILHKEYAYTRVTEFLAYMYESIEDNQIVINALEQIKKMDEYTFAHSVHTAFYSMFIAMWMEMPKKMIKKATQAGFLHDIGKIYVPKRILNKRGPLTTEEYEVMKKHPLYGYSLIHEFTAFDIDVKRAVLLHHERMDGSGYPLNADALYGGVLPHIIAVADTYDAMTTDRVYKKGVKAEEAIQILQNERAGNLDRVILKIFLDNMPVYDFKERSA